MSIADHSYLPILLVEHSLSKWKLIYFSSSRHYSESTYREAARETRDRSRSRGAGGGGSGATDHYNREERF